MKEYILLIIAAVLVAGCVQQSETAKQLQAVEVREYEGERLDSAGSFRDNSIKGTQYVDAESYRLEISGLVDNPLSLTYEEAINFEKYSKVVTLYCVEGWSRKILWEGILFKDLVSNAKIQAGANTVIFHAYDGYTTSLPLDYLIENEIIVAYKQNNAVLPPENGFPFQLVAEDKYGIKWIKWITKIEISDDESYRGFWESRGYSQESDVGKSVYE